MQSPTSLRPQKRVKARGISDEMMELGTETNRPRSPSDAQNVNWKWSIVA